MSIWDAGVIRVLKLVNVDAGYGDGLVLRNVSLEVPKGRITCLVGRNGAGKTTTMRSIMGLINVSKGDIVLAGNGITGLKTYDRAKAGIGYVPQGREIIPRLTVEENLMIGLEVKNGKGYIPESIYETFPILKEFLHRPGGDLSGGQQQQLAIARAILAEPKVLLLDEPTEGIQPSIIQEIGKIILELKSQMAILIVEQYLEFVLGVTDYCYVMENGRITMKGEPENIDMEALQATMSL